MNDNDPIIIPMPDDDSTPLRMPDTQFTEQEMLDAIGGMPELRAHPESNPLVTRYRYDRQPLTKDQARHARAFQLAHLEEVRKQARAQLDGITMGITRLKQSPLPTHRKVAVPIEPGEPGYGEASPHYLNDAGDAVFEWVGGPPAAVQDVSVTGTMR